MLGCYTLHKTSTPFDFKTPGRFVKLKRSPYSVLCNLGNFKNIYKIINKNKGLKLSLKCHLFTMCIHSPVRLVRTYFRAAFKNYKRKQIEKAVVVAVVIG